MLMRCSLSDSLGFKMFLLRYRIKELFVAIVNSFKGGNDAD